MRPYFSYTNILSRNIFSVLKFAKKNRADLIPAVKDILLAREAHFFPTIADLYDIKKCPKISVTPIIIKTMF